MSLLGSSRNKYFILSSLFFTINLFWGICSFGQSVSDQFFGMNEFDITHVGFNTEASDYGPSFVGNELWYCSYPDKYLKKAASGRAKGIYYKIFTTGVDDKGVILYEPRKQFTDLNTPFHEGPVAYCEKTGELFVTLSNVINVDVESEGVVEKKEKIRLSLVIYKKNSGKWTLSEEMPFNDKIYSVGQPSVTPSGDTLFFASDIKSLSKGGTDIFMVIRKNGRWGNPIDLGDEINSSGDEMFPYYHPSGMLIFASDKRDGNKGGLDLYCSDLTSRGFSMAKPIDQFNSPYDDFGLIINPTEETGYFVSNRPGQKGNDDIFMVKIKKTFVNLTGTVSDDFMGSAINEAEVTLFDCDGKILNKTITNSDGKFVFKVVRGGCYVAAVKATGYPECRRSFEKDSDIKIRLIHERSVHLSILDYDAHNLIENVRLNIDNLPAVQIANDGTFFKKLTNERVLTVFASIGGYLNQHFTVDVTHDFETKDTIFMRRLELNRSYLIDSLYFDNGSWELNTQSLIALDRFLLLLNDNPAIKVEIGSFTDSRGENRDNLSLSRKRVDAIVSYIKRKGVPKRRLDSKGYGESKPLYRSKKGVDGTVEEHTGNNRTEYRITGFVR